ncbi:hypothetical protein [Lysinibacillus xylanilyticus]|uniref:hypothetical protein n=1 Tax=Lysinibacillus xylanilyticus TaxID=582475 RepID=UPI0036D80359
MSGQKAIEFSTQALVTAATEMKGVEVVNQSKKEDGSDGTNIPNTLKGSHVFKIKEKE